MTVKLRTGWSQETVNVSEVARACEEAGAAAIVIHGRSREQRYTRAADWDLIGRVAAERGVPVVGNGDILTHYEARQRRERSGVGSVMVGRGALIKPWIFRELREERDWLPTASERLGLVFRLVELMREHFGRDERGSRRILGFLPWHLGFFCRYRPLPEAGFAASALEHPLIHTRHPFGEDLDPLEALLRDPRATTHEALGRELVAAASPEDAEGRARVLAAGLPAPEGVAEPALPEGEVAG